MRVNIGQIKEMKQKGERIPMLTAYDYSTAKIVDEVGVPLILVGDSLGMVVLGYETTIPVTMDEMIHHSKAVVRGTQPSLIVGDMPFMTYTISVEDALRNAARFIQEAGCQAVKLEGGVTVADTVKRMVECGIPVMGHIGLTPQSVNQLGGWKSRGRRRKRLAAAEGCPGTGGSRRLRGRAGDGAHSAGDPDFPEAYHPDHRHRRWQWLRRPGPGDP